MVIRLTDETYPAYFWAKVEQRADDECWPWIGSYRTQGYGQIQYQRVNRLAHREAWRLTHGDVPDGLLVCHTCDVKGCCNPAHLFLGTNADNSADMVTKGRQNTTEPKARARGGSHGKAKLTENQVLAMRADRNAGMSWRALGRQYGISHMQAKRICEGLNWAHVG
jgi:hypothetical protein